jgi:hypothetical protein
MKNVTELQLAPGTIVFLDRIEEDVATLLLGEGEGREENVPCDQLPPSAREGDRLRVTAEGRLAVDSEATEAGRAAVADLMTELLGEAVDEVDPKPPAERPEKHR